MSGPVTAIDALPRRGTDAPTPPPVRGGDRRSGRHIRVRAPKGRRTVSGWCFADHIGPGDVLKLRPRLRATWSHAPGELSATIRGVLEGIQLWVALPETTRHGAAEPDQLGELNVPRACR
jgi:redox-sensitive bicupin YhaK (pirin superfamily)